MPDSSTLYNSGCGTSFELHPFERYIQPRCDVETMKSIVHGRGQEISE
jgi:hypothetical protein